MLLSYILQGVPEALPLNPIARWEWVFPVIESIHICGFCLLIGTVVLLDLRLLGRVWRSIPVSRVARDLAPWIHGAIAVQLMTGAYLFSGDPHEYVQVAAFRTKMVLLVIALLFHFGVVRSATKPGYDSSSLGFRGPVAIVSLGLWASVMVAGLWIGNL